MFSKSKDPQGNENALAPFIIACGSGKRTQIEELLPQIPDINQEAESGIFPLLAAVQSSEIEIVDLLLSHGADINKFSSKTGASALSYAITNADRDMTAFLLKKGANPNLSADNSKGQPPLISALSGFYKEHSQTYSRIIKEHLLPHPDIDINQPSPRDGKTALHYTVTNWDWVAYGIFAALIKQGVDLDKADKDGNTPLMTAVAENSTKLVSALLRRGTNINATNNKDETPLHLAVRQGSSEMVELLLSHHANATLRDRTGLTPLEAAIKINDPIKIKILEQAAPSITAGGAESKGEESKEDAPPTPWLSLSSPAAGGSTAETSLPLKEDGPV